MSKNKLNYRIFYKIPLTLDITYHTSFCIILVKLNVLESNQAKMWKKRGNAMVLPIYWVKLKKIENPTG